LLIFKSGILAFVLSYTVRWAVMV